MDKKPFHVQVHTAFSGKHYGKTYNQQLEMIKAALGVAAEKLVIEVIDYAELDKLKKQNEILTQALNESAKELAGWLSDECADLGNCHTKIEKAIYPVVVKLMDALTTTAEGENK